MPEKNSLNERIELSSSGVNVMKDNGKTNIPVDGEGMKYKNIREHEYVEEDPRMVIKPIQHTVVDFNPAEEKAYNTGCVPKESKCTATKIYYYDRLSDADDTNTGYKSDEK